MRPGCREGAGLVALLLLGGVPGPWTPSARADPPAAAGSLLVASPKGGLVGDVNQDGLVDVGDLAPFLQAWRVAAAGGPWPGAADMDGDGQASEADARLFLEAMLHVPEPAYRLHGLCLGPYLWGPTRDARALTEDWLQWLVRTLAPYCHWVRTFGATGGLELVPAMARERGLQVAAGCWLSGDSEDNEREFGALMGLVDQGLVDLAVVGGETLLRGDLEPTELIAFLRRAAGHGVPVTTNETWDVLMAYPEIMTECDVLLANFYPFWEGLPIERAVWGLNVRYEQLAAVAGGKEIIVGETGWPSDGQPVGQAVPNAANAASYALNAVSWARARAVKCFWFEAFDEPWKSAVEGDAGAHWGLWTEARVLKDGMARVFRGETVADNWTDCPLPGVPSVVFDSVPAYGSENDLSGHVTGVDPSRYRLAVFIYVGEWWTKPTFAQPLTPLGLDGTWVCDITTGGNDAQATRIAAFLVPVGYSPPLLSGAAALPPELADNAIASLEVSRGP